MSSDAPLHLARAESGRFVLTEPVSQTVVVADALADGYARMTELLAEAPPPALPIAEDRLAVFERRGHRRALAVAVALGLPLLWTLWIAVEVHQARRAPAPSETQSAGHPTRIAPTISAAEDGDDHASAGEGEGAKLEGAKLEGAKLEGAKLEGAKLEGSKVEGEGAVVPPSRAAPEPAPLEGAKLEGAKLEGEGAVVPPSRAAPEPAPPGTRVH